MIGRFVRDVGAVVAAFFLVLLVESLAIGILSRREFVGGWEMAIAREHLLPIALAGGLPVAVVCVLGARLVAARRALPLALLAGLFMAIVAYGVSSGRHMAAPNVRVPFVLGIALSVAVGAFLFVRKISLRSTVVGPLGLAIVLVAWVTDVRVLPRLYPAFHLALFVLLVAGAAAIGALLRFRLVAATALALAGGSAVHASHGARVVAGQDNLRRVLVEHAPIAGRVVALSAAIAPPAPLDDDTDAATLTGQGRPNARALEWSGKDIVLVTIDALRADHVSAYGYGRPTTPNIDRLAARGARFDHAYCPTPHTSYSIASMMTGTYLRPLLAMGASDDGETWAEYLRHYGYRTAAFYPPAVFFIDEHRFPRMHATGFGFEYRKEEFADPKLRASQVRAYLGSASRDKPLFLWVHLFEPHEPYEMHPDHPFVGGDDQIDAYDSEIAAADGFVGELTDEIDRTRPGAAIIVSADHGEEFGDHGGRYHGTTVYEEQVRVPLVIVGPGIEPGIVETPVQTIDLLPTVLAALDVPRPARLRGRDLGALLHGPPSGDLGLAFAETDDYTMVARGKDRLVCARRVASCTLFDVARDPEERAPEADPARVLELRKLTAAIERDNGRVEASHLPDALRRAMQGDADSAEEVAALLDDARVEIRRAAARSAFHLHVASITPQLTRSVAHEEDAETRTFAALALVRAGDPFGSDVLALVDSALASGDKSERRAAALAIVGRKGQAPAALVTRGEGELVAWWNAAFVPGSPEAGELDDGRSVLDAFAKARTFAAAPALVRSLDDVRLRIYVADALGAIGNVAVRADVVAAFARERYLNVRASLASAAVKLGATEELRVPLARFMGVPTPLENGLGVAKSAGLLTRSRGGWASRGQAPSTLDATVVVPPGRGPLRLWADTDAVVVDGTRTTLGGRYADLGDLPAGKQIHVTAGAASALWLVRRTEDIPPPAPRPWRPGAAGASPGGPDGGL